MEVKKQYAYFSAAIREGAKLRPQVYGSPFQSEQPAAYWLLVVNESVFENGRR